MERGQEHVHWEQGLMGHGTGARCKADRSVPRTSLVPTMCQVLVGMDGRGPRSLDRDPENQSLVSLLATALSKKER